MNRDSLKKRCRAESCSQFDYSKTTIPDHSRLGIVNIYERIIINVIGVLRRVYGVIV